MVSAVSKTVTAVDCTTIATGGADGLYVAGRRRGEASGGFASQLDALGALDPGFDADAALAELETVTALAVGGESLFLAGNDGSGLSGAVVMRLTQSGLLDSVFGDQGRTWFDFPALRDQVGAVPAIVRDLEVLTDRRLIASGSVYNRPVVACYLGDAGGTSPGMIAFEFESTVEASEADGQAVVRIRRVGGNDGAVSVAYATGALPPATYSYLAEAQPGVDYTPLQGRLEWADGEGGYREISVPLAVDPGEPVETFGVRLSDPGGGAGLGTDEAQVAIRADASPAARLGLVSASIVTEGETYRISVARAEYGVGTVSVTVSLAPGSAAEGDDYQALAPVTLSWVDGELGVKDVLVQTLEDATVERPEQFTVALGKPLGNAVLGVASATVTIVDDDLSSGGSDGGSGGGSSGSNDGRGGGGGSAGWLLAGLFGLLGFVRRRIAR
jgi:uncharacterized membrane protein YgcG